MKKIAIIFLVLILFSTMTACSETLGKDNSHAYAEITTSTGEAHIVLSQNYYSPNYTGLSNALANKFTLYLQERDTAEVHFYCEQCEHDESVELTAPSARVFSCDCVTGDDIEGFKEYFAIALIVGEAP